MMRLLEGEIAIHADTLTAQGISNILYGFCLMERNWDSVSDPIKNCIADILSARIRNFNYQVIISFRFSFCLLIYVF
jgi:hypothetical protein